MAHFREGDRVVYSKQKVSSHPSPRAKHLCPSPRGEDYVYDVDKYWIVTIVEAGRIQVVTRRGKHHWVAIDDTRLRRAGLFDRLRAGDQFPQ